MQRSRAPYIFLAIAAALAISALVTLILKPGVPDAPPSPTAPAQAISTPKDTPATQDPGATQPNTTPSGQDATKPANPSAAQNPADPAAIVSSLAAAIEAGDLTALQQLAGPQILTEDQLPPWRALLEKHPKVRQPNGIREVGELELNQVNRWAIDLEAAGTPLGAVQADFRRNGQSWKIDALRLPAANAANPSDPAQPDGLDALAVADAFVQAVLRQDFATAKRYADSKSMSDAKIAGLCIIFEEGQYRLRKHKPLRAMFQRPDTCGFLANVETNDGSESAQFSLNLKRLTQEAPWKVTEINLDRLLADYAQRVAGGDVYFSPLVKNPAGGETLAVYFGFDEDEMSPRTQRQLEIVSHILLADPVKKITLSGHTDALGTDPYNRSLSSRRAVAVKEFLLQAGVKAGQIVTEGKGASQPRRPNVTETGQDNPEGRRANRRTEIYLDF
jgi:outer membrane protein OmpA-like peptidoglycan-associated protein